VAAKLFVRKRDGRIEVRLNEAGRAAVREIFGHVVAAERDPDHEWRTSLNAPITPSRDDDDPLATLARQSEIATNVELAVMTLNESQLNENEAWAWLATIQIALRSTALAHGFLDDDTLAAGDADVLNEIHLMQQLLFDLAACL